MNYLGVCLPTIYSHHLNDVEVVRARNNLFNKLLTTESLSTLNSEILSLTPIDFRSREPEQSVFSNTKPVF